MNYSSKVGFSLVEILVTIAVLSVLSALAVSQYAEYRQKAYDSIAMSALFDLRTANQARKIDYQGLLGENIIFFPDQSIFCYNTGACDAFVNTLFPGFAHKEGVYLNVSYNQFGNISGGQSFHCNGSQYTSGGSYGYKPGADMGPDGKIRMGGSVHSQSTYNMMCG